MVEISPFPGGNNSEFPYPLSIFGAWMLCHGIKAYMAETREWHETGSEDAGYCSIRTCTAIREAEKLRKWAVELDPDYLEATIEGLDGLFKDLAAELERFNALDKEEQLKMYGGNPPPEIDLSSLFGDGSP